MHFIQNSWFVHHWVFLLLPLIGSVVVIAYMKDRKNLLRMAGSLFLLVLVAGIVFIAIPELTGALYPNKTLLPDLEVNKSSDEHLSGFSRILDFIARILKDRLND
ncbi:MAG TPA: hypothetical protein PLP34_04895 [Chitinophagaceae bacterium]|nr:hypothetical protein [Chitinophagaceae bacterium]HNF71728.1 hypothetical protein [Chitinophagaceae bacterium]